MPAMSFISILVLVTLIVSLAGSTLAQGGDSVTEVTLWQFGQGRLLAGQSTLPLQPLATASDGSATMYLYQVLNPATITTIIDGSFTTQTMPSVASRTVIASASGWVEPFGTTDAIACRLVNSKFGECFTGTGTAPANSGVPTPERFRVALPSEPASLGLATTATPSPTQAKHSLSVGPIVGGVIGGIFALICLILCIALLWRRRRQVQKVQKEISPHAFTARPSSAVSFAAGPQLELGQGIPPQKGDRPSSVHRLEEDEEQAPPAYAPGQRLFVR
ncbi:hypothetical protein C8R47DRAFT_1157747 [Mycena vitilis]|nr:hypothetical protein C8R47DRAFT_1157747 [Mycena vitilis]